MNTPGPEERHRANPRSSLANDLRELARVVPHAIRRELSGGAERYVIPGPHLDRPLRLDVTPNSELVWHHGSERELLELLAGHLGHTAGLRFTATPPAGPETHESWLITATGGSAHEDHTVHGALGYLLRALLDRAPLLTDPDRAQNDQPRRDPDEDPDDVIIVID